MAALAVNDPVSLPDGLEGVIIRIEGSKVCVRLTGKSAGKGETHDFAPAKSGKILPKSQVNRRTLTRLDELRLRRELGGAASSRTSATTPTRSTTSSTTRTPATGAARTSVATSRTPATASRIAGAASSSSAASATTPGTSGKARIEEIKKRREEMRLFKSPTPTETATAAPKSDETPHHDQASAAKIKELSNELQSKSDLVQELQTKLQTLQTSLNAKTKELEAKLMEPETPTKARLVKTVESVQENILETQKQNDELADRVDSITRELATLQEKYQIAKTAKTTAEDQLVRVRAENTEYQNQLRELADQSTLKMNTDAAHYKERAKLQAELSSLQRTLEVARNEKLELEANIEELTLDKEQLETEKEELIEKYEETKLDSETYQMEAEELKLELEDAQARADRVSTVSESLATASETGTSNVNAEDMLEAVQVQNARLREALIKLREQSSLEKMEFTRTIKGLEKDAKATHASQQELDNLKAVEANLTEQVEELKDQVEEGAAFESMVEDLSDRVMMLEEALVNSQNLVREMEEAAELTAEMEEVQSDELKALGLDLEGRDTIIRNLEEAIKMQRRREDDFRRTMSNYKTTVSTLKEEKQALLDLQKGDEGERSTLQATSQAALARAAQLVSDAAKSRKVEASRVVESVSHLSEKHLSVRLETLLPANVASAEIVAVKGELLVAKAVATASKSLGGIKTSFKEATRPALPPSDDAPESGSVVLSEEVEQQVATMFHQAAFAVAISDTSSFLLHYLAAGQWPYLLSPEQSSELGSVLFHGVAELDSLLVGLLKSLTEEGDLSVEQSSTGELRLALQNTESNLRSDLERKDGPLVPTAWKPPGMNVFHDASVCKFVCMGVAAALSVIVEAQASSVGRDLVELYHAVEQCCIQSTNASNRLRGLDVNQVKLIASLEALFTGVIKMSTDLLQTIQTSFSHDGPKDCNAGLEIAKQLVHELTKLTAFLRAENLDATEHEAYHPFSPEAFDAWDGITSLARAIDGDQDDVNYIVRSHEMEEHISTAIENESKLLDANQQIAALEKNLVSRSKEASLLNVRLAELEKLLAKSNTSPVASSGANKAFDFKSSKEYAALEEENRMLTEAMEVMQREVEMYETEIRALKDFKSPNKRGTTRSPRRPLSHLSDMSGRGIDDPNMVSALEATLFRPALRGAIEEASRWKAHSFAETMMSLPPLPAVSSQGRGDTLPDDLRMLSTAISSARRQKASIAIVDLTRKDKTPRAQLTDLRSRIKTTSSKLDSLTLQLRSRTN